MNQTNLFILALVMVPVIVLSGLGIKVCQLWMSQRGDQEPPLGNIWQLAVACASVRTFAILAEVYALLRLLLY